MSVKGESYSGVKGKKLYFGFVDLEKAFDGAPREVISWAMRELGVEEWLVSAVMSTQVQKQSTEQFMVIAKGPLNGCVCVCVLSSLVTQHLIKFCSSKAALPRTPLGSYDTPPAKGPLNGCVRACVCVCACSGVRHVLYRRGSLWQRESFHKSSV